jgi:hypothetical protein
MPECSKCLLELPRSAFTKSRLKNKQADERACRVCIMLAAPEKEYQFESVVNLANDEFRRLAQAKLPSIRDVLCPDSDLVHPMMLALRHRASEDITKWFEQDEIDRFLLDDDDFIQEKANFLSKLVRFVVIYMKKNLESTDNFIKTDSKIMFSCLCTQNGGVQLTTSIAMVLHCLHCCLPVFCSLLNQRHSDKVLLCLTTFPVTRRRSFCIVYPTCLKVSVCSFSQRDMRQRLFRYSLQIVPRRMFLLVEI